jgi:spore germination protein GerM
MVATERRSGPAGRRHRRRWAIWLGWAAVAAVIVIAGFLLFRERTPAGPGQVEQADQAALPEAVGGRPVEVVFPNLDATGFVVEQRQVPSSGRLEDELLAVMSELAAGPTGTAGVPALPVGTRPLAVFYDETRGSVILDFSRELVAEHIGGSASELATLGSLLRTIALNFPEVSEVLFLVEGAEVETLAGHLSLDRPFQPRRWL